MGWTTTHKPKGQGLTEFFIERGVLRWSNDSEFEYKVLDSATVNLTEYYAAVEKVHKTTGEREVWAAVFLIRHFKADQDGYNFGWEDMCESMGPCADNCPARILDLLTPTDNEYAIEWRQRCRAKIAQREQLAKAKPGTVLEFTEPVRFGDTPTKRLIVRHRKAGRFICWSDDVGWLCRITANWLLDHMIAGRVTINPAEEKSHAAAA